MSDENAEPFESTKGKCETGDSGIKSDDLRYESLDIAKKILQLEERKCLATWYWEQSLKKFDEQQEK